MKFLILGSAGMAGHQIALYLKESGYDVDGFARRELVGINSVIGDVRNKELLSEIISKGNYDAVVNCVGVLNQFAENNKENAVYINSYLPHYLADITADTNTQIIHMSTDCVFSGALGNYTEDSIRDGATFYDRTKALGELEDGKNLTLRNSIVGPDINAEGIGLLNWFMKQSGEIKGFTKAMWTGMTTLQLAKVIEKGANEKAFGLYNMVPDHNISKFDLLGLFNKYLRENAVTILPFDGFVADKTLIRTRFDFGAVVPDYEKMVSEMAEWMLSHKDLYPHYNL